MLRGGRRSSALASGHLKFSQSVKTVGWVAQSGQSGDWKDKRLVTKWSVYHVKECGPYPEGSREPQQGLRRAVIRRIVS